MNLETLNLFCEIARSGSFSEGARAASISQSAASQAMAHLEAELGVLLIDRSLRPFKMTAQGTQFYEGLRGILRQYQHLTAEIRATSALIAGTVHVAAIYSIGLHVMRHQIQQFISRYPQASIRLEYLQYGKVLKAVLDEQCDLGLISYPAPNRALQIIPLRREKMVFVAQPGHRLSVKTEIAAADLDGENFVAFDPDLTIRKAIDRALKREKAEPNVVLEFDNIETIKQAVEIGAGVSLLPEPTVLKEVGQGSLTALPLAIKNLSRPIGIIHRRRKRLSPAAIKFIELLKAPETSR